MRLKFFFLYAFMYFVGVTQCQDDYDDGGFNLDPDPAPSSRSSGGANNSPADNGSGRNNNSPVDNGSGSNNNSPVDNVTECKTENGESGVCVTYYLCDLGSKTIIEDGHTLIDTRAIDQCPEILDTCCQRDQVASSSPSPTTSKPVPEEDKNFNPTDSMLLSGALPDLDTSSETAGSCGYSNPGAFIFSERAAPGERVYAEYGEFPWMVAILKRLDDGEWKQSNYVGGGSLIHPSVVMTAAHKLKKLKSHEIKIRAGEYVTNSEDELYEHQERNVYKIVVHPHYFRPAMTNDIALLFLETPVTVNRETPHIGIGCLAPRLPPPGTICYGMGWGADDFANKKVFAAMLKKVKLPLVGKRTCEKNLRKTSLGIIFRLHESLLCAGGEEGVDTCRGDGGAPLVCPLDKKESRFAIYGMVAYGMGCGGKDRPGVYVNVPNLYDWVGQQLVLEDFDTKSYIIG